MESFVRYVLGEMRVIVDAPLVFGTAAVVLAGAIWSIASWRYGNRLSKKDGEISLLARQRDDYLDKLEGASPDQARARIEALEARLARLEPRRLSADQRAAFTASLRSPQARVGIIEVTHEVTCADCNQYAADFSSTLRAIPGWQISDGSFIGPDYRAATGLGIRVTDPANPSPQAVALMQALQAARIPFDVLRGGLHLGIAAALVIMSKPVTLSEQR